MPVDDHGRVIRTAIERLLAASSRQHETFALRHRLRPTDLRALELVVERREITPTELSRALGISSGGTTAVIDRLAGPGLVTRASGTGGRRRTLIAPSDVAVDLVDRRRAQLDAEIRRLIGEMPIGSRDELERWLNALAAAFERDVDRQTDDASTAAMLAGIPTLVRWG